VYTVLYTIWINNTTATIAQLRTAITKRRLQTVPLPDFFSIPHPFTDLGAACFEPLSVSFPGPYNHSTQKDAFLSWPERPVQGDTIQRAMPEVPETRYVVSLPDLLFFTNCIERHYSYECKAGAQERPYIARPSRTQQLFNPKLLPKLSSETPNALQEK
jgi:hypothetical protein